MTDMPTGLIRRLGGSYALRRRIPDDLIASYGKKEIVKAHGTSDFAEAKRRHARLWVELDDEFADRRRHIQKVPGTAAPAKARQIGQALGQVPPSRSAGPSDEEVEYALGEAEFTFRQSFEEECAYETRDADRRVILETLNAPDQFLSAEQMALKDILSDARWDVQVSRWQAESAQSSAQRVT